MDTSEATCDTTLLSIEKEDPPDPETTLKQSLLSIINSPPCLPSPNSPPLSPSTSTSSTPRKIIIHLVRHAEAQHNLKTPDRWTITDPALTPLGIKQAVNLRETFAPMNNITHILYSPLRRTLHTTQLSFTPLATHNLKIITYPNLREIGGGPTCAGSKMSVLLEELAGEMKVDTSLVPEGWESNDSETGMDIRERARKVRSELWEFGQEALKYSEGKLQGNVEIAVVSHGGFLTWLVETKTEQFWNAEYKSYEFASEEMVVAGTKRHNLIETEESKKRTHFHIRK